MTTRYEIVHTTEYNYSDSVALSHHVARLSPRSLAYQESVAHELQIDPSPAVTSRYQDYFGNGVTFFAMLGAHKRLTVRARSQVSLSSPTPPVPSETAAWETATDQTALPFEALEFVFDGMGSKGASEMGTFARQSFPPGRPLLEAVIDLTARIHSQFTFDPKATTVATPLSEFFRARRGVCQDFARLEIACLRTLGLAARYVSGYLETVPAPGTPRLLGADASHAWLAVYCPEIGWIHVDPTNNLLPSDRHVILAWGPNYSDVSPIRGVILGGGDHSLRVNVDVNRLEVNESHHGATDDHQTAAP
jgi:transglutaminase-like putative cysteine protease